MELEHYFNFINSNAIRIVGTRIGIETIIDDYEAGASPEEIVLHYPTLSLEQTHAAITYYLANRDALTSYLKRVNALHDNAWREQQQHPSAFVRALREKLEAHRATLHQPTDLAPLPSL